MTSKYIGRSQAVVANQAYNKDEVDTLISNIDLSSKVSKSGDTMSGDLAIQSTQPSPLIITGTDSNRVNTKLVNATDGVSYVYHELEADGGRRGYFIQNGSGGGNSLPAEETYVWSEDGNVSLVPNAQIGNRLTVNDDGSVDIRGQLRGSGQRLITKANWSSATALIDLPLDSSLYTNYYVYWYINHASTWERTHARFKSASGYISGSTDYRNNTSWKSNTGTSHTENDASYAGAKSFMWLAGNGTAYNSQGWAMVSVPTDGTDRASVRGVSQLISRGGNDYYQEAFSSTLLVTDPHTNLTHFTIYGSNGSSDYGEVHWFGLER